jgi:hypothetical protein
MRYEKGSGGGYLKESRPHEDDTIMFLFLISLTHKYTCYITIVLYYYNLINDEFICKKIISIYLFCKYLCKCF